MDFESCNPAAQFAIQQSQNSFVIPNATPFIEFDLNVLATGHVGLTIRIFDVTQPLSFAVFNRVRPYIIPMHLPHTLDPTLDPPLFISHLTSRLLNIDVAHCHKRVLQKNLHRTYISCV